MDAFFLLALALIFLVTLCWPLNVPLMALAYKVRLGAQPVPLETSSFWARSTFAALGLAGLSAVSFGLLFLAGRSGIAEDLGSAFVAVPIGLFVAYLPLAAWFLFWAFALEELYEGLGVFGIYVLLPGLPAALVGWLVGYPRILQHLNRLLGL